jgi:hypothetical protein
LSSSKRTGRLCLLLYPFAAANGAGSQAAGGRAGIGVGRRHRDAAGGLLVPAGGANPGTVGAAFDFALRLLLDPVPNLRLAARRGAPGVLRAERR